MLILDFILSGKYNKKAAAFHYAAAFNLFRFLTNL